MPRAALVCALVLATLVSGCSTQRESLVTDYHPGGPVRQETAATPAVYHLTRRTPADGKGKGDTVEVVARDLFAGEPVGFRRNADGALLAVAGRETLPLEDGDYCWHVGTTMDEVRLRRFKHDTRDSTKMTLQLTALGVGLAALALLSVYCALHSDE